MTIDRDKASERRARIADAMRESERLRQGSAAARRNAEATVDRARALLRCDDADGERQRLLDHATEALKLAKVESRILDFPPRCRKLA